ncbi:hypothetical protein C5167_041634 [Papaver somniferum]|uniref:uncharacterized protein LOC113327656 n=1 Tax=Papaver somniferum TaxID=3469 RepID=UPI000E6FA608|nr:uncharacterized protein LOC113327656 [Papaver somniferum]RZC85459.1 hypothetical protein C5167_041634 [Papaver somniferum]
MATSSSCFSLVPLIETHVLKKTFTSSGLCSKTLGIDSDTTFRYWSPAEESSSRTLPALILLHGFGPNPLWQWSNQVKHLSKYFAIYVPDLIFFGESTTNSMERSEVFQAVSVAKLLEMLGVVKYSVMGTSYGGFVAYHMARLWPERVEKVVIASSGVNMTWQDNVELLKRGKVEKIDDLLIPSSPDQLRNCIRMCQYKRFPIYVPDFVLSDFINSLFGENRKEKLELLEGVTLGREDVISISRLPHEVLIVWGEHDQIFPLHRGYELKELIGDNVSMEVMPKTSHTPQAENPKLFNSIVEKFLRGVSSS